MEYGYEKVMEVQRRCGINFEDADKALKAEKGDVNKACVYAMRKKKKSETMNRRIGKISNIFTYRVIINKEGKPKVDVSMGVICALTFLVWLIRVSAFHGANGVLAIFYLCVLVLTIITGNTLIIAPNPTNKDMKMEAVEKKDTSEEEVYEQSAEHEVESEDDGFNSIEIK